MSSRPSSLPIASRRSPRSASSQVRHYAAPGRPRTPLRTDWDCPSVVVDGFTELDFGAWEGLTYRRSRQRNGPTSGCNGRRNPTSRHPRVNRSPSSPAESVALGTRSSRTVPDGQAVVVTHVTPIKALLRVALDAPPSALFRFHSIRRRCRSSTTSSTAARPSGWSTTPVISTARAAS